MVWQTKCAVRASQRRGCAVLNPPAPALLWDLGKEFRCLQVAPCASRAPRAVQVDAASCSATCSAWMSCRQHLGDCVGSCCIVMHACEGVNWGCTTHMSTCTSICMQQCNIKPMQAWERRAECLEASHEGFWVLEWITGRWNKQGRGDQIRTVTTISKLFQHVLFLLICFFQLR